MTRWRSRPGMTVRARRRPHSSLGWPARPVRPYGDGPWLVVPAPSISSRTRRRTSSGSSGFSSSRPRAVGRHGGRRPQRIAGHEQQPRRQVRADRLELPGEAGPVQARHAEVAEHGVERPLVAAARGRRRRQARSRPDGRRAPGPPPASPRPRVRRRRRGRRRPTPGASAGRGGAARSTSSLAAGRVTVKRAPPPGRSSIAIVPP